MSTFFCKFCGIEQPLKRSTTNTYCNNKCQRDYQWKYVTVPRIESGLCTANSVVALKRYLSETRGDKCELCHCPPIWNSLPLVLQLDHIDGDSDNNQLSNIRLLCPNCHTQTPTFTSRGFGSKGKKATRRNTHNRKRYTIDRLI